MELNGTAPSEEKIIPLSEDPSNRVYVLAGETPVKIKTLLTEAVVRDSGQEILMPKSHTTTINLNPGDRITVVEDKPEFLSVDITVGNHNHVLRRLIPKRNKSGDDVLATIRSALIKAVQPSEHKPIPA